VANNVKNGSLSICLMRAVVLSPISFSPVMLMALTVGMVVLKLKPRASNNPPVLLGCVFIKIPFVGKRTLAFRFV
jgi:hypothetical protein